MVRAERHGEAERHDEGRETWVRAERHDEGRETW